ncbi:MAG: polyamine aminopropyltransferase [Rhodospirillales bacterium]|nr:polyamine aminopropyltransferase [Rhodospirillales bacterium]
MIRNTEDGWFEEKLYVDLVPHRYAQRLAMTEVLCRERTAFQELLIFDNPRFGRVLALDGILQTTEADECIYHEMLVHVPLLAHGTARRVLIIGGGDGGTLRQVLRHPVAAVTMVEIDQTVIDRCRAHMPMISQGAFDDPRLRLVIGDGRAFLAEKGETFDAILVDSPDPVGPGEALFTAEFYDLVRRRLATGGVMVAQDGSPFFAPREVADTHQRLRGLFADASVYLVSVPSYVAAPLAIAFASDQRGLRTIPLTTLEQRFREAGLSCRYYSPAVHQAAFLLPPMIAELLSADHVP